VPDISVPVAIVLPTGQVVTDSPDITAARRARLCGTAGVPGHRSDGEQPLAPLRAVRPPSPEATCGPEPGDSCMAKVGRVPRMVNAPLWMAMWTTWGEAGVSLWTALKHACEVADRQACRPGLYQG
jgi:hypothetical protein